MIVCCGAADAVNSVLAIGGVGGLAIGLAGREILENLFTGLIILSSSPFEVGDEVCFTPPNGPVSTSAAGSARRACDAWRRRRRGTLCRASFIKSCESFRGCLAPVRHLLA
jgi:Mechanosensitive ion channel